MYIITHYCTCILQTVNLNGVCSVLFRFMQHICRGWAFRIIISGGPNKLQSDLGHTHREKVS